MNGILVWFFGVFIYIFIKKIMNRNLKPYISYQPNSFIYFSAIIWPLAIVCDVISYPKQKQMSNEILEKRLNMPIFYNINKK